MVQKTFETIIEFVNNGNFPPGGGTNYSTSVGTGDFIGIPILISLLLGTILGVLSFWFFRKKLNFPISFFITKNNQLEIGNKVVTVFSSLVVALLGVLLSILVLVPSTSYALNNASNDDFPTKISEKIVATVDGTSGEIVIQAGSIENTGDELAIGMRQVKTSSSVDVSDATIAIICGETELYHSKVNEIQTNPKYCKVPVNTSSPITYQITMDAQKAIELCGSKPLTISTTVDLICSPSGTVKDKAGNIVKDADVVVSYIDPYTGEKVVYQTKTDDKGKYQLPDLQKNIEAHVEISSDIEGKEYSTEFDVTVENNDDIPDKTIKQRATSDVFTFTPPTQLVFDGEDKNAKVEPTVPESTGDITIWYSSDGEEWTTTAPKDAGTYKVKVDSEEGKDYAAAHGVTDSTWTFTIAKRSISDFTLGAFKDMTYNCSEQTPEAPVTCVLSSGKTLTATGNWTKVVNVDDLTTFTASGNYVGAIENKSTGMKQKSLSDSSVVLKDIDAQTYTGSEIRPEITLTDGKSAISTDDYTIAYKNNIVAATSKSENPPTVTVTGKHNYYKSISKTFTINKAGSSITLSASSGTCAIDTRVEFSITSFTGSSDTNPNYVATSQNPEIATVNLQTGDNGLPTYYVTGVATGSTKIEVTAESDNYALSKTEYSVTVSGKPIPEASNFVFSGPASTIYDGQDKIATITPVIPGSSGEATIFYSSDASTWTQTPPKDCGTYFVKANVAEGAKYGPVENLTDPSWKFNVDKCPITDFTVGTFDEMTYNGEEQTPNAEVKKNNLVATGSWSKVTDVDQKTTFTADGNFVGIKADQSTNMKSKSLTDESIEFKDINDQQYTGAAITPSLSIYDGEKLISASEFDATYSNNTKVADKTSANPPTAIAAGKHNYKDSISKKFNIIKATGTIKINPVSGVVGLGNTVEFSIESFSGSGDTNPFYEAKSNDTSIATVALKTGNAGLPTYVVTGVAKGQTTIVVKAKSDNYNEVSTTYSIVVSEKPAPTKDDFKFSAPSPNVYDGKDKVATVEAVTPGEVGEITVFYSNNGVTWTETPPKDADTYIVKINATEGTKYSAITDFTDSSWQFKVLKCDASDFNVGEFDALTYNGSQQTPSAEVSKDGLVATGMWTKVTNVGDKAYFIPDGNFEGLIQNVDPKMKAKSIKDPTITISDIDPQTYTGSELKPAITVKDGSKTLGNEEYSVSYSNNIKAAESTAENPPTVTITGKGNYGATNTKTFTINQASSTMSFSEDAGTCGINETIEFSITSFTGSKDTHAVYSVESKSESVATVAKKEGTSDLPIYVITGKSLGSTTIEVTAESDNYGKVTKSYSVAIVTTTLEFYAVYNTEKEGETVANTLSFYYDKNKSKHVSNTRTVYDDLPTEATVPDSWGYNDIRKNIKNLVIDVSVEYYQDLKSSAYMFYNFQNLDSMSGINYIQTNHITNMSNMFAYVGYSNRYFSAIPNVIDFNTSNVTDMSCMFNCYGYVSQSVYEVPDVSKWDTGKVTDMNNMFSNYARAAYALADVPETSSWNTESVNNMKYMFSSYGSTSFILESAPKTGGWNTENVTDMSGMFFNYGTSSSYLSEAPDTSKWNTSNVEYMQLMFSGYASSSSEYNAVPVTSGWNTEKVTDMSYMFGNYANSSTKLECVPVTTNWNTASVKTMASMFNNYGANSATLNAIPDTINWTTSNVTDMTTMFNNYAMKSTSFNYAPYTTNWDTSKVVEAANMFNQFGYSSAALEAVPNTSNWSTASMVHMQNLFRKYGYSSVALQSVPDTSSWTCEKATDISSMFFDYGYTSTLLNVVPSTANWKIGNVVHLANMFYGYAYSSTNISSCPDISGWDTSKVTSFTNMFNNYAYNSNLTQVPAVGSWDTKSVKDMSGMFCNYGYNSTDSLTVPATTSWNTSNVTNMKSMFTNYGYKCTSLSTVPDTSKWDTSNVTSMFEMFCGYAHDSSQLATSVKTTSWTTPKLTNMVNMFNSFGYSSKVLQEAPDTASWNPNKVTDFKGCFAWYGALSKKLSKAPDTSKWTVDSAVTMTSMFEGYGYQAVISEAPNTTTWKTDNVTSMQSMFDRYGYYSSFLEAIPDTSQWSTKNVTDMSNMFADYGHFGSVRNAPDTLIWNTEKVINMSSMFYNYGYSSIQLVDTPKTSAWKTPSATNMTSMFEGYGYSSKVLASALDCSAWDTSKVTSMNAMFKNFSYSTLASASPLNITSFSIASLTKCDEMFYGYLGGKASAQPVIYGTDWTSIKTLTVKDMFNGANLKGNTGGSWASANTSNTGCFTSKTGNSNVLDSKDKSAVTTHDTVKQVQSSTTTEKAKQPAVAKDSSAKSQTDNKAISDLTEASQVETATAAPQSTTPDTQNGISSLE